MKNQPQKIFLQIGEDTEPETPFDKLSEVSWCEDRIFENDLVYVQEPTRESLLAESKIVAKKLRQTGETKFSHHLAIVIEKGGPGMVAGIRAGDRAWWDSFLRQEA